MYLQPRKDMEALFLTTMETASVIMREAPAAIRMQITMAFVTTVGCIKRAVFLKADATETSSTLTAMGFATITPPDREQGMEEEPGADAADSRADAERTGGKQGNRTIF